MTSKLEESVGHASKDVHLEPAGNIPGRGEESSGIPPCRREDSIYSVLLDYRFMDLKGDTGSRASTPFTSGNARAFRSGVV